MVSHIGALTVLVLVFFALSSIANPVNTTQDAPHPRIKHPAALKPFLERTYPSPGKPGFTRCDFSFECYRLETSAPPEEDALNAGYVLFHSDRDCVHNFKNKECTTFAQVGNALVRGCGKVHEGAPCHRVGEAVLDMLMQCRSTTSYVGGFITFSVIPGYRVEVIKAS